MFRFLGVLDQAPIINSTHTTGMCSKYKLDSKQSFWSHWTTSIVVNEWDHIPPEQGFPTVFPDNIFCWTKICRANASSIQMQRGNAYFCSRQFLASTHMSWLAATAYLYLEVRKQPNYWLLLGYLLYAWGGGEAARFWAWWCRGTQLWNIGGAIRGMITDHTAKWFCVKEYMLRWE